MTIARRLTTAATMLFAAAGSLAAQSAAPRDAADAPPTPVAAAAAESAPAVSAAGAEPLSFAPTEPRARVGVHALSADAPAPVAPPRRDHVNQNVALMIVGGAGLIVGAIIGGTPGTVVMVGGGVVGLIGLYRYLQ